LRPPKDFQMAVKATPCANRAESFGICRLDCIEKSDMRSVNGNPDTPKLVYYLNAPIRTAPQIDNPDLVKGIEKPMFHF
jgi:hypothetical protein